MAAEIAARAAPRRGAARRFNEAAANGRGNRRNPKDPPDLPDLASMRPRRMAAEIRRSSPARTAAGRLQ